VCDDAVSVAVGDIIYSFGGFKSSNGEKEIVMDVYVMQTGTIFFRIGQY